MTSGNLATRIGLLVTCISCGAYAQVKLEPVLSTTTAKPAYVVAEIQSPSISIAKSEKSGFITYEKKTPAATKRVLLGVQYNSRNTKTGKSSKSEVLMGEDVLTLSQTKGEIAVSVAQAAASFMLSAARVSAGGQVWSPDLIEVRMALYEVGVGVDEEQHRKYGKQVSNPVFFRWKP